MYNIHICTQHALLSPISFLVTSCDPNNRIGGRGGEKEKKNAGKFNVFDVQPLSQPPKAVVAAMVTMAKTTRSATTVVSLVRWSWRFLDCLPLSFRVLTDFILFFSRAFGAVVSRLGMFARVFFLCRPWKKKKNKTKANEKNNDTEGKKWNWRKRARTVAVTWRFGGRREVEGARVNFSFPSTRNWIREQFFLPDARRQPRDSPIESYGRLWRSSFQRRIETGPRKFDCCSSLML